MNHQDQCDTVQMGHGDVREQQVDRPASSESQALPQLIKPNRVVTLTPENVRKRHGYKGLVIHDHNQ